MRCVDPTKANIGYDPRDKDPKPGASTGEKEDTGRMSNEQRIREQGEFVRALHRATHKDEFDLRERISRIRRENEAKRRKHKQQQGKQK
mgnify:CR=1 FL=1